MGEKPFCLDMRKNCGYLVSTYARDKCRGICHAYRNATYYHLRGMNLYDAVFILQQYGYYLEDLKSITLEGKEGMNLISMIMKNLEKAK